MTAPRGRDARRLGRVRRQYGARRHTFLFYSLLLTLGAGPLVSALGYDPDVIFWFLGVNLVAAVSGVQGPRRWRQLRMAAVVVLVLARLVAAALHSPELAATSLLLWVTIAVLAATQALRFAMRARTVDAEHVYAGLSAYLLAGFFCGVLYRVIEDAWPGSFVTAGTETTFSIQNAIYFSFVTLATLGYGDIVPRTDVARGIAIVEAVTGQLYLAVMIARLVSLYTSRTSREGQS